MSQSNLPEIHGAGWKRERDKAQCTCLLTRQVEMSLNSVKKQKSRLNIRILIVGINQKSGNKDYNIYTPGDSSQLRQLHMFSTLSGSLLINDAPAFAPDSGLRTDDP